MPKLYLHPVTERIWHWIHALLVFLLILSGIQIHWPEGPALFGGYSSAITWHNWLGRMLVADFVLWLAYNLISKRIVHYLIRKEDVHPGLIVQARFYLDGIFRNEPHPYPPSAENKFNPLQKASYFMVMFFLMPLLLSSGVVYLYPAFFAPLVSLVGGLKVVALLHYGLAILFAAFFVAHLYLATTGVTVLDNFTAMLTGYARKEGH